VADTLDTVLLLALPASGKSEVRAYLDSCDATALSQLHLRPPVHLDDYPYVHLMRRISAELSALGQDPAFFASAEGGWLEPRDWGTLIHLLNEDYEALTHSSADTDHAVGVHLLDRLDAARRAVGAPAAFADLAGPFRSALGAAIAEDVARLGRSGPINRTAHTVVIEFARGGPAGAAGPLPPPHGYAYSLSHLSLPILESAVIVYVWVDPDDSRRRNRERARPGDDGSILHHGVPETVMHDDYGRDDMAWLIDHSELPGTVTVSAHGRTFHVPAVRFDNRSDRTSFLRDDPAAWDAGRVAVLHRDLTDAFDRLVDSRGGR
jgi:hypothetical protein